jgi:hypothetical protein
MKGACMKYLSVSRRMGVFIAAMVFLFALTTVAQAGGKSPSLKSQLSKNGIAMKLVRLDRTDGFMFGLSFKGPQNRAIVLAPGLERMFLVVSDGNEIILQADATGNMQIIQASGELTYVLCVADAVIGFLRNATLCTQGDPVCYLTSIVTMVTDVLTCNATVAP